MAGSEFVIVTGTTRISRLTPLLSPGAKGGRLFQNKSEKREERKRKEYKKQIEYKKGKN